MSKTISVIYGSVRSERKGINAARFFEKQLKSRGYQVHLIDPLVYKFPLLEKMYKVYEEGTALEVLENVHHLLAESDGFIIVSGEYNHSIPPALKNILDHYQTEYFFKPSGIVTYSAGNFGGVRAGVQLRAVCGELGMPSISSMFPIPTIDKAFDEDGNALDSAYEKRVEKFLNEFDWYVDALKTKRQSGTPY